MVKLRAAGYCNLKLLLILSVVYGHWIEPWIWGSEGLRLQYQSIYLVHMPLFAFLSGLFLRRKEDCLRSVKRTMPVYLICQTLAVLLGGGQVKVLTPWWHLWYLLSMVFWAGAGWLWFRFGRRKGGGAILLISLALGCLSGFVPWLDRTLSGSRTVVFFPYFWAGLMMKPEFDWKRLRPLSLLALVVAAIPAAWVLDHAGVTFLYHAAPFGRVENGALLRLACYGVGFASGLFLLAWVPNRRFPFTRAGADTMMVYLLHAPLVAALRAFELQECAYLPASVGLIFVMNQIFRWSGNLYGIVPGERREAAWPRSRRFMKNTESRSTASSCH